MRLTITLTLEPSLCVYCKGRRWTDDQNWTPDYPETWRGEREPHNGLVPCGGCNQGGWDVPVVEHPTILTRQQIEERLEQNGDAMRFDEALEDLFGHFDIPARVCDASIQIAD